MQVDTCVLTRGATASKEGILLLKQLQEQEVLLPSMKAFMSILGIIQGNSENILVTTAKFTTTLSSSPSCLHAYPESLAVGTNVGWCPVGHALDM